jgi:hypothetical protein
VVALTKESEQQCDLITGTPAVSWVESLAWKVGEVIVDLFVIGETESLKPFLGIKLIDDLKYTLSDSSSSAIQEMIEDGDYSKESIIERNLLDLYSWVLHKGGVEEVEFIKEDTGADLCGGTALICIFYAADIQEFDASLSSSIGKLSEQLTDLEKLTQKTEDSHSSNESKEDWSEQRLSDNVHLVACDMSPWAIWLSSDDVRHEGWDSVPPDEPSGDSDVVEFLAKSEFSPSMGSDFDLHWNLEQHGNQWWIVIHTTMEVVFEKDYGEDEEYEYDTEWTRSDYVACFTLSNQPWELDDLAECLVGRYFSVLKQNDEDWRSGDQSDGIVDLFDIWERA